MNPSPLDKVMHYAAICGIVIVLGVFNYGWLGVILGLVLSFGKEAFDSVWGSGWSWKDIAADIAGLCSGIAVLLFGIAAL